MTNPSPATSVACAAYSRDLTPAARVRRRRRWFRGARQRLTLLSTLDGPSYPQSAPGVSPRAGHSPANCADLGQPTHQCAGDDGDMALARKHVQRHVDVDAGAGASPQRLRETAGDGDHVLAGALFRLHIADRYEDASPPGGTARER